jgi:NTE family protein
MFKRLRSRAGSAVLKGCMRHVWAFAVRCTRGWAAVAVPCLAALLSACSAQHYLLNQPLEEHLGAAGYSIRNLERGGNTDSLNIVLALSGGGFRAAALSFAVMEVLHGTEITWDGHRTTLLDEVDFISGVSGGALPAAYYGLHRDAFFTRFPAEVLFKDLQGHLVSRAISPAGLWRQTSPRYGRGDLLQEVLDEEVFHGATFAELSRRRPMVYVNATDMRHGARFEFSQDQFDYLCSDLSSVPLARAVAASMAVPVVFSPITLWNYTDTCTVNLDLYKFDSDIGKARYIHLVDGGLADNIGVRMPLEIILSRGGIIEATKQAGFRGVRKRVFILVNAQLQPDFEEDSSPDTPGLVRQLRAAIDVPIDRYSSDSVSLLRSAVGRWKAQIADASDERLGDYISRGTEFHVIEVSLKDLPREFRDLKSMATSLRLTEAELERMRAFVRASLSKNPEWQKLHGELH